MAQDGIDNDMGGLFDISISDSEGEDVGIDMSHGYASSSKKDRTGQSEEAFRAVQSGYRAKVENGEVSRPVSKALLTSDVGFFFFGVFFSSFNPFPFGVCSCFGGANVHVHRTSHLHFTDMEVTGCPSRPAQGAEVRGPPVAARRGGAVFLPEVWGGCGARWQDL
jgi:hypothetical protein